MVLAPYYRSYDLAWESDPEESARLRKILRIGLILLVIFGILFPLLLCWMAWKTALTRSMESATGLLYIELALVLASTIVGAGLAFAVGVLV